MKMKKVTFSVKLCLPSRRHIGGGWWVIGSNGEALFCKTLEGAKSLAKSRNEYYAKLLAPSEGG